MKIRIIMICLLGLVLLNACLEDHTNLDYNDVMLPDTVRVIDKVSGKATTLSHSEMFQGSFSLLAGTEVELEAEVVYSGGAELGYEWQFDGSIIGNEKKLHHVFTKEGRLILLVYRGDKTKVTDYHMLINLIQPFGSGVYVLAKQGGKTVVDFMRYYTEKESVTFLGQPMEMNIPYYEEQENVFSLYNDGEELQGSEPVKLVWGQGKDKTQVMQVLDRDWRHSMAFYGKTIEKVVGMDDEFVGEPVNLFVKGMVNVGMSTLLYGEQGDVYVRTNYDNGTPNTGRFSSQRLRFDDPNDVPDQGWMDVEANLVVADKQVSNNWAIIHEKSKERFLFFSVSSTFMPDDTGGVDYSVVLQFPEIRLKDNEVALHKFDKDVIAVLPPLGYPQRTHIIYKDGANYRLQAHTISASIYSVPHTVRYTIDGNTLLGADVAALLDKEGTIVMKSQNDSRQDIFYVISENTIYQLDANGGNKSVLYSFESGRKITNFFRLTPWASQSAAPATQYFSGWLFAVAFDNGEFKIGRLYKDPLKPNEMQCTYLLEKKYDGGVADIKFIYSNVIM
ncbi:MULTISPECIES: hypothetical protein [Butyricimonas]|uniref:hypothetical protein n=1 Tax=Butyricimonas TaxID=574697 RepID=UPI000B18CEFF|nr:MULTISPECIES: hypothetical protein [Butyricimonas]